MKKLPIKRILVLTIFISVIVGMIYWQYVKKNKENNFQENYTKYIKELSCTPEKPLDKGNIYAEAMKQYWKGRVDTIWYRYEQWKQGDHPTGAYDGMVQAEKLKRECGLEEGFFGQRRFSKNDCLPLVTYKNGTLKVYNPYNVEKDDYLYKPENYNKDVDFTVNLIDKLHKEDCCKLLTYNEMKKENEDILNKKKLHIMESGGNEDILKRIYFLKINSSYYPVTQCGKILYF